MNEPAALKLPDETWIEILGQLGLGYRDLKCVARVCRRLYKLEKDSSLDARLFRTPPKRTIKNRSSVKLHPVLEATDMTSIRAEDGWLTRDHHAEHNVYELQCREEFATYPSTKCLIINMAKGLKIEEETGVTVEDVWRAVGNMWEEPAPKKMLRAKRFRDDPPWEEHDRVTWWDLYAESERNSWTGWLKPQMNEPAALKLPDETWIEILGQLGLGYRDLKCVARVCRRLYKLEKDSSLDDRLFRTPFITPPKQGAFVTLHPVLEKAEMAHVDSRVATLFGDRTHSAYNAHKLHCTKEFATSPSTNCLKVIIGEEGLHCQLERETGVTLKDVLKALGEMRDEEVHLAHTNKASAWSAWSWYRNLQACGREKGWQSAKVRKGGVITIRHHS
ncbi:hypothetical protein BCR35DRAFT_336383 [Leucosporidium creatinivorum]|uniref:F-box domain-containing protein n=1 Tax=Leucosporidium creatinivorum TaxID=106004 RepID=A0A1Y2C6N5_9BASI|nr:hypothetical protein BCR35DRAFT_336383 [Leucosporidium creatinivorum]